MNTHTHTHIYTHIAHTHHNFLKFTRAELCEYTYSGWITLCQDMIYARREGGTEGEKLTNILHMKGFLPYTLGGLHKGA